MRIPSYLEDPRKARAYLEKLRWPSGPVCPHCKGRKSVTRLATDNSRKGHGREGLFQCRACRKQFTVTVGTLFQDTRVPLHKWLLAINHLILHTSDSVTTLKHSIGVTYKTAWSMSRRVRAVIASDPRLWRQPGQKRDFSVVVSLILNSNSSDYQPEDHLDRLDREAAEQDKARLTSK